jgi:hypothetical protein
MAPRRTRPLALMKLTSSSSLPGAANPTVMGHSASITGIDSATPRRQNAWVRARTAGGQRAEQRAQRDAREERVVHDGHRRRGLDPGELRGERSPAQRHHGVVAAAVLLAREVDLADRREPARARVDLAGHALAGGPDAQRQRERRVSPARDERVDLGAEREDDRVLAAHEREDLRGERGGRRAGAEALLDGIGEVVVDVEDHGGTAISRAAPPRTGTCR